MLTVYLDQNKWIDLARAETGHPKGAHLVGMLADFKQAVDAGRVRFPLSCAHYLETGKRTDRGSRIRLAKTMLRLAGEVRIAPSHAVVPWEIRRALTKVFGLPNAVEDLELFGRGLAHAFAEPDLRYTPPPFWGGVQLSAELQEIARTRAETEFEARVLGDDMPDGVPSIASLYVRKLSLRPGERFADGQRAVATWLTELGRRRLDDLMLATAFTDISGPWLRRRQSSVAIWVIQRSPRLKTSTPT